MNEEAHIERHKLLHQYLDELIADYVRLTGKHLNDTSIMEFMRWSHGQTINPSPITLDDLVAVVPGLVALDNKIKELQ